MANVQQHVSGDFRSTEDAPTVAASVAVSALRTQALPVLSALHAPVCGQPLLPSFSARRRE